MVYRDSLTAENLPDILPIFPLHGVLLLPGGHLPLNIFEPRYKALCEAALSGNRLIGIVQPRVSGGEDIFTIGCAGKIIEFSEKPDGRYEIVLAGMARFRLTQELETQAAYRSVRPIWGDFTDDLEAGKDGLGFCRDKLKDLLKRYFQQQEMDCDWEAIDEVSDGKLMTCLAMACPFEAIEKQALLEEKSCKKRAEMFMTMLEMEIYK